MPVLRGPTTTMIGAFIPVSDKRPNVGFVVQENGCWEWVGSLSENGYGFMSWKSRSCYRAHRYYYEREYGPIPEGLQIDHLCRNRKCVRPDHLEAVTRRENMMRGFGVGGINARKTHCLRGHAFTPENTYWSRNGNREKKKRRCLTCARAQRKSRYESERT